MRSSVAVRRHQPGWLAVVVALALAACGGTAGSPAGASPSDATRTAGPASGPPLASPAVTATARASAPAATLPSAVVLGDRLVATIDGVERPCAMAATQDAVWVTGNQPSVVARIDPATNAILDQVPVDGAACGIAVGADGRIWVALLSAGAVVAIDPDSRKVTATIDGLGANLWDLKAGFGSVWVADRSDRTLVRIDPSTATVVARIPIGRVASGLAMTDDAVWVADEADGSVRRIDPATNEVDGSVPVPSGAAWFVDDGRALLVADPHHGSVQTIDPAAATATTAVRGLKQPLDGTVLGDVAYVPDGRLHGLAEIDVAGGSVTRVDTLEAAKQPFVAEVAFGDVWVLDFGGERIWRIRP